MSEPELPGSGVPASAPAATERVASAERLRRRADFLRCYRQGRRRQGRLVAIYFAPNGLGHPRFGITASRKVGGSVVRQRLKRRLREIYRRWPGRPSLPALDLVLHVHPAAAAADFAALSAEILRQFRGLASPPPSAS